VPERGRRERTVLALEVIDDLWEVPGEGQNICVLLLGEGHIDPYSLVHVVNLQA